MTTAKTPDRLARLLARKDTLTGIDFIQVTEPCTQTELRVTFINDPTKWTGSALDLDLDRIVISTEVQGGTPVRITSAAWSGTSEAPAQPLILKLAEPGGFGKYRLTFGDARVDRIFNGRLFDFKVGCDDRFDCAPDRGADSDDEPGPSPEDASVCVDYLARDFLSLREAFLAKAAERHPEWTTPIEADLGVTLIESLAALGDELSYIQDRVAREALWPEATERRTLRKKARLLDYELHDGRTAHTQLAFTVSQDVEDPEATTPGQNPVPTGLLDPTKSPVLNALPVLAVSDQGTELRFEVGQGLRDRRAYRLRKDWNSLAPYLWDEANPVVPKGTTTLFLRSNDAKRGGRPRRRS